MIAAKKRTAEPRHLRLCVEYWRKLRTPLVEAARQHGYTLAIHGSLSYDFDLIAIPWVEEASAPEIVVEAIRAEAERIIGYAFPLPDENDTYFRNGSPGAKPHGRRVWTFHLGGGPYIDLSVMPRIGQAAMAPDEDGWYIASSGRWEHI